MTVRSGAIGRDAGDRPQKERPPATGTAPMSILGNKSGSGRSHLIKQLVGIFN
jgi:hypothetical protein